MYPATREAKTTPGSNLRRWQSAALSEFELFVLFVNSISDEEIKGFWGRRELATAINPTAKQRRRSITIHIVWQLPHTFVSARNRTT